jgi:hypothetical protein
LRKLIGIDTPKVGDERVFRLWGWSSVGGRCDEL